VTGSPFATLARIRRAAVRVPDADQRCELCGRPAGEGHPHVVDTEQQRLLCACRPCAALFDRPAAGRFRAVPDRWREVALPPGALDALSVPVGVAFFVRASTGGSVRGFYPGPAGVTESLLSLDAWDELVAGSDQVATLEPDVEALLVWAVPDAGQVAFVVPVDACYELAGRLRSLWRGFDGGADAAAALAAFFDEARRRSSR
jgi:hypothetical protein